MSLTLPPESASASCLVCSAFAFSVSPAARALRRSCEYTCASRCLAGCRSCPGVSSASAIASSNSSASSCRSSRSETSASSNWSRASVGSKPMRDVESGMRRRQRALLLEHGGQRSVSLRILREQLGHRGVDTQRLIVPPELREDVTLHPNDDEVVGIHIAPGLRGSERVFELACVDESVNQRDTSVAVPRRFFDGMCQSVEGLVIELRVARRGRVDRFHRQTSGVGGHIPRRAIGRRKQGRDHHHCWHPHRHRAARATAEARAAIPRLRARCRFDAKYGPRGH